MRIQEIEDRIRSWQNKLNGKFYKSGKHSGQSARPAK